MKMPNPLRRFPMAFAALTLLVSPFGCRSDTPAPTVAEVPAQPGPVTEMPPSSVPAMVTIDSAPDLKQAEKTLDRDVQKTAGAIKEEARDEKEEALRDGKAIEENAKKSVEKAVDNLLGDPK